MSDILCVTNRLLCEGEFFPRLEEMAKCSPAGIILREKDLSGEEYEAFAGKAARICRTYKVPCIFHSFVDTAIKMGADKIHLPLSVLRSLSCGQKQHFTVLGASCHSVEEALEAQALGCTYITAGHIFATDCKKGLAPRGIEFLHEICESVSLPVYAIGGIDGRNFAGVRRAGAKGACVMSGWMRCEDVAEYMKTFRL